MVTIFTFCVFNIQFFTAFPVRSADFYVRTVFSAELLPPLRQLSEAISPEVNRSLVADILLIL